MEKPSPIYIGKDATAKLIQHCEKLGLSRFTLVADQNTWPVLGESISVALKQQGYDVNTIVLTGQEILADEYYIVQVLVRATKEDRTYIAVGSGTLTDIVRFVSSRTKASFISIPTAPSVDGFTSASSSLALGRMKQTILGQSPSAIFADLPTLCAAPRPMIAAGFGDMLGKFTALADWQLGRLLWDEPYDEQIARRTRKAVQGCVDSVQTIGQASSEGVQGLMNGLIESGLCMMEAGYSRPAAGAEHYLSHFWETKLLRENRPAILHGAKVGVACVLVAQAYEELKHISRQDVTTRLRASALPNRAQEIKRIETAYGPIAEDIAAIQAPFLDLTERGFELLKQKIVDHWAEIQQIAARVPSAQELTAWLKTVGGATTPAMLGLDDAEVALALDVAHYFRNRFTVIKLNRILGI
jgi:glycerol-1-phosphate dehydrogenase [NAD(P)+]